MKIITKNKKAYFEYDILDTLEAGIVLKGDEVKSLRAGNVNITGAFAVINKGELYLINCTIGAYSHAYSKSEENTTRSRKLLVHKRELNKIIGEVSQKGITLVPLKLYFKNGRVKVEIALSKHKKAAGKKQHLKEQDLKRQTEKELKKVFRY